MFACSGLTARENVRYATQNYIPNLFASFQKTSIFSKVISESFRLPVLPNAAPVFESPVSPHPPLGLVIWIDNQFAAFTPEGKISFGVLEGGEEWLEIEDLELSNEK